MKNLLAVGFGLLLLLIVEGILALIGVSPLVERDPLLGFAGSRPVFTETVPGRYELDPSKAHYFNSPQSFLMPKPDGVFRIITLGGSTTYGRPFLQVTSFGTWLEKLIERYGDGRDVEVINAGGISYASYRVRRLMREMAGYQPDLFVLYCGHNEFLEARTFEELREEQPLLRTLRGAAQHSRLYSLMAQALGKAEQPEMVPVTLGEEVEAVLEKAGGPELYHRDPAFRSGVISQYRDEIAAMIELCQKQGIPLVFATLPVNLSGITPFKSEHSIHLEGREQASWTGAFQSGEKALANGQPGQALAAFSRAMSIDDGYALLHYRMGQAHERLGEVAEAYIAYDRARQEDIVPLRALNEFNQIIRELTSTNNIPLADVEAFFRRVSPGHIPGANLFADHVHPTIEGQQIVAWVILNAATDSDLVPLSAADWQQVMPEAREFLRRELAAVPERYRARGLWGVGRLMFWAGKVPEAYAALKQTCHSIRDVAEIPRQLGELELMRGDAGQALIYLEAALKIEPDNRKAMLARAAALGEAGRGGEALELLDNLTSSADDVGYAYVKGSVLLDMGRFHEAAEVFQQAIAHAPEVASYRLGLAEAYKQTGQPAQALQAYRDYLEQLGAHAPALQPETWLAQ